MANVLGTEIPDWKYSSFMKGGYSPSEMVAAMKGSQQMGSQFYMNSSYQAAGLPDPSKQVKQIVGDWNYASDWLTTYAGKLAAANPSVSSATTAIASRPMIGNVESEHNLWATMPAIAPPEARTVAALTPGGGSVAATPVSMPTTGQWQSILDALNKAAAGGSGGNPLGSGGGAVVPIDTSGSTTGDLGSLLSNPILLIGGALLFVMAFSGRSSSSSRR